METIDRIKGTLLGLACGDALGTTVEFKERGEYEPIDGIVGGGPFDLEAGQWTDDTSMALCLATSLIETDQFDPEDQLTRYVRWYREGYMSCTGECFDIGTTTRMALETFDQQGRLYPGSTDEYSAGNGSLMRLAPVPMAFHKSPEAAIDFSKLSSRTTHGAVQAVDACRYFGGLIVGALEGADTKKLLSTRFAPGDVSWETDALVELIDEIAAGSFKEKDPSEIESTGYVVDTLEAALWAFYRTDNFRDGALEVVNRVYDSDTVAAVYGQLAGAYYGVAGIPDEWLETLAWRDEIEEMAEDLPIFSPYAIDKERKRECNRRVEKPVGEPQQACALCRDPLLPDERELSARYANLVCPDCDEQAVNAAGESPDHNSGLAEKDGETVVVVSDGGDNPVFVDGQKCWRRYRYGGWITFKDQFDCESLKEFYEKHFPVGSVLGAFDP